MNHKTRARQGEEYLYCVAWDYDTVSGALAPNQVHDTIGKFSLTKRPNEHLSFLAGVCNPTPKIKPPSP